MDIAEDARPFDIGEMDDLATQINVLTEMLQELRERRHEMSHVVFMNQLNMIQRLMKGGE